eukprot:COSAG02_NODE_7748_length_2863_cov_1.578871_2_plen_67_part_00
MCFCVDDASHTPTTQEPTRGGLAHESFVNSEYVHHPGVGRRKTLFQMAQESCYKIVVDLTIFTICI